MKAAQKLLQKKLWPAFAALGLLAMIGLSFLVWRPGAASAGQPAYQTTAVRRGDLLLTITGSGTLVAGKTVDLGFAVSGSIAELNVQLGDPVTAGQVLAALDKIAELKVSLQNKEIALKTAQKNLEDLLSGGDQRLAQALADRGAAQAAYEEAKNNLRQRGDPRCSSDKTLSYYYEYLYAQKRVAEWEDYLEFGNTGYGRDFILDKLTPMRKELDAAYNNWKYCEGYTEQEILESQASLMVAEANYRQAERIYQNLLANAGIDPIEVEIAEAEVKDAGLQLQKAQNDLAGAVLTAPMDGAVITLSAGLGDRVESGLFITLADLFQPAVEVNIDETDLQDFGLGCPAQVVFDAIPDRTFEGLVTQVSPVLVTVRGVDVVQGLVELEEARLTPEKALPLGLSGVVDVTCGQARNVLLAPVSALYEPADEDPYVYVLNSQGEAEKRTVEIGLKSTATAEVRSGLSEGELVITAGLGRR